MGFDISTTIATTAHLDKAAAAADFDRAATGFGGTAPTAAGPNSRITNERYYTTMMAVPNVITSSWATVH
jgi:hypothetical protein